MCAGKNTSLRWGARTSGHRRPHLSLSRCSAVPMSRWLAALVVFPALLAAQSAERSTRAGVYSQAQAKRGERIYAARCLACHQTEQFAVPTFMQSWKGQTAEALYDSIRRTMPTDNPAGLKPQEYADIVAYLFKMNRLPSGETELKATKADLQLVRIE